MWSFINEQLHHLGKKTKRPKPADFVLNATALSFWALAKNLEWLFSPPKIHTGFFVQKNGLGMTNPPSPWTLLQCLPERFCPVILKPRRGWMTWFCFSPWRLCSGRACLPNRSECPVLSFDTQYFADFQYSLMNLKYSAFFLDLIFIRK